MRINVEVDCTPEEARAFLGLPNVQPMQEKLLQEMHERMAASLRTSDPQEIMRLLFAPNLDVFERLRDAFARASGAKRD